MAGSASLSGETVTEQTAMTYTAVWNAVSLISGTVSTLPLHLYQSKNGNRKEIARKNSLYRLLHDEANPYQSAMAFRETLMAHVLTWGNGYAEIVRDGFGKVVELWPITPNRIKAEWRENGIFYSVSVDGQQVYLPKYKVLHIAGLGFDGFQGYSPIGMARKTIGLGMALETFGALYFGQGTHVGRVISHPGHLDDRAMSNLKAAFSNTSEGLAKAHKLMVLEEGMKLEKIGIPPEDSQFLESRQFQIPEIARLFNLPPHKLKDLSRSSFNNIESEQISFVTDSILPWIVRLEQAMNMQLLTKTEKEVQNLYFKHVVEGLLRGDAKSRGEFYRAMFGIGAMSQNEIRSKEDLDPIKNGDEYYVPLNMVPSSMVKEILTKNVEKNVKIGEKSNADTEQKPIPE